jgi:hypothetical protein
VIKLTFERMEDRLVMANPVMALPSQTDIYISNSPPIVINGGAIVTDTINDDFSGGELQVQITNNADFNDQLTIGNQGTGPGQIGVNGNIITYAGQNIGTFFGGTGFFPLFVNFTNNLVNGPNGVGPVDSAIVQLVAQDIQFSNSSLIPPTATRTVEFTVTDVDFDTSPPVDQAIQVVDAGVPPIINGFPVVDTYRSNSPPLVINPAATTTDLGFPTNSYNAGNLTVQITGNADVNDILDIGNEGSGLGQIGVVGNTVTYGAQDFLGNLVTTVIGTFTGGHGGTPLVVTMSQTALSATGNGIDDTVMTALIDDIRFHSTNPIPPTATRTVTFTVTDGSGGTTLPEPGLTSLPVTAQIQVQDIDVGPIVLIPVNPVTFTTNGGPILLGAGGSVTDPDTANFAAGSMMVSIASGANVNDVLSIRNQGTAAGQIGVSGSTITFGGIVVGAFSGGNGFTPLSIHFNANATPAVLTAILNNLTFSTSNSAPTLIPRTVTVSVFDGQKNGSASVTVDVAKGANVAPNISLPSTTINYLANAPATLIASGATVTDPDAANFNGGVLSVRIVSNPSAKDSLSLLSTGTGPGQIKVVGTQVKYGGVIIGILSGTPLNRFITFNANATLAAVQAVVQSVTFASKGPFPVLGQRNIQFELTDGQGGSSSPALVPVNVQGTVNQPILTLPSAPANFIIGTTSVAVDNAATLTDGSVANYATGKLVVNFAGGAQTDDRLVIGNQGTGAGKIHTVGNKVFYGSQQIGTFTGGDGFNALVITFNANARQASTQALIRDITYQPMNANPVGSSRLVQMQFFDGHGGVSSAITQTVSLVTDVKPVITPSLTQNFYIDQTPPVPVDPGMTVSTTGFANLNGGKLTVRLGAGGTSSDRLSIENVGLASGEIGVSGNVITFGGTSIATFTGGVGLTPLVVTFNQNATQAAVTALLQAVSFSTVFGNSSSNNRAVQFQITDPFGGLSNTATVNMVILS